MEKVGAFLIAATVFLVDGFSSIDIAVAVLYVLVILKSVDLFSKLIFVCITCLCIALTIIAFIISHGLECADESCGRGDISIAAIAIASLLALKSSASRELLRAQLKLLARRQAFLAGAQRLSLPGSIGFRVPPTDLYWSEEGKRIFEFEHSISPTLDLMLAVTHPDDQMRLKSMLGDVCSTQSQLEVEFRLVMANGAVKYLQMWAAQYVIEATQFEFIGALIDITTTRTAEEALLKSQGELAHVTRVTMLGELAATIAHEVNQPSAAVLTDSQAGLRWLSRIPPDLYEDNKVMEGTGIQAQRAADVIKRVRDLYINKIMVNVDTDSGLDGICGDKVRLQQVIIKFIMNAMQSLCATRVMKAGTFQST